ncbi:hypothetical protein RFI_09742, partial [Reticulomyxa filosa]
LYSFCIAHHKVTQKKKQKTGRCFLPQHAQLTLRSNEVEYKKILEITTIPIKDRLRRIDGLVEVLRRTGERITQEKKKKIEPAKIQESEEKKESSSSGTLPFKIDLRPVMVNAIKLQFPQIKYMLKGEEKPTTTCVTDIDWGASGGRYIGGTIPLRNWAIVVNAKDRDADYQIENIEHEWISFISFRDLPKDTVASPDILRIEYDNVEGYRAILQRSYQLAMLVLPEEEIGSQYKSHFTRILQSDKAKNKACLIQCILRGNVCHPKTKRCDRNVMKCTFDAVMAKIGNVLFQIDPNLPSGTKVVNMRKTWCVGVELSHRSEKPSAIILALSTSPLEGGLRSWHFTTHLNPSRKDVITLEAAATLMFDAIQMAVENVGTRNLPENIIVLRGGLPDNRLNELYSKELVGVARGIHRFKKNFGNTDENVQGWKCKLTYIVRCKQVLDRFGQLKDGSEIVHPIKSPATIFDRITSERYLCYNAINNKQKNWIHNIPTILCQDDAKTRPSRYVVLKDEIGFAKKCALDLFQLLYSLSYTFKYFVWSTVGPTAYPGPLKYAKHYAERFSQMIFRADKSIVMLKRSKKLINQPQLFCICTILYFLVIICCQCFHYLKLKNKIFRVICFSNAIRQLGKKMEMRG